MTLILVGGVSAADTVPATTAIEGTIVGIDLEAGTVDVLQADGTIVTIEIGSGDYDHPIVELLAEYFGGAGLSEWWSASVDAVTPVLELEDGTEVVSFAPITDPTTGAITGWLVTIVDENGVTSELTTDSEQTAALNEALSSGEGLTVNLQTTAEEGGVLNLVDVGAQIAAYHELGLGFGELVKIYTIAQESEAACEDDPDPECVVTVEMLAQMALEGTGMGSLFATYGKPSMLGVGHVRRALGSLATGGGAGDDGGGDGDGGQGVCNARSQGGNANANGQDISC
jgi:hypothetical protein